MTTKARLPASRGEWGMNDTCMGRTLYLAYHESNEMMRWHAAVGYRYQHKYAFHDGYFW